MNSQKEYLPKFDCRVKFGERSFEPKQSPYSLVMSIFVMLLCEKPHSKQKSTQNVIHLNANIRQKVFINSHHTIPTIDV